MSRREARELGKSAWTRARRFFYMVFSFLRAKRSCGVLPWGLHINKTSSEVFF
jgi:hypothetical protein